MGWIQFLFGWEWKPRIPSHLVTPFDITAAGDDEILIFKAGKAKDRQYVERMMRRYQARNAIELLARIPKRKRPSVQKRIRALVCRAEGSLPYDPIRREVRAMRADNAPPESGIRRVRMPSPYRRG